MRNHSLILEGLNSLRVESKVNEGMSKEVDKLTDKDWAFTSKQGWKHGGDIKANWSKYIKAVEKFIGKEKISKKILDELTDFNYHSLRKAIEEIQGI